MITVNDNMRNGKLYNGNTLKFGITVENIDYRQHRTIAKEGKM